MTQSCRDDAWLQALSTKLQIQPTQKPPQLISTYSPTRSPQDDSQATLLLTQTAEQRRKSQRKLFSSTKATKPKKWAYEDYGLVMANTIAAGSSSVGVTECVWNRFQAEKPRKARTGTLKFRRDEATDTETDELTLDLMGRALKGGPSQIEVLRLLAHFANRDVVSKLLPTAVRTQDLNVIRVLVEEGADPNTCLDDFVHAAAADNFDFVRLFLQAQTPMSDPATARALPGAVERGSMETTQLLLACGADANFDGGSALKHAIDAARFDLVVSLLQCASPPSAETLAAVVSYVFLNTTKTVVLRYQLMETILHGGAAGTGVNRTLCAAVRERWPQLVQLLISKGAPITFSDGEAYRYAVSMVDLEILRILNAGQLGSSLASSIFPSISKTQHGTSISPENWHALATMLLGQGATGDVLHEALVDRVNAGDLTNTRLLLARGASVDYNQGAALRQAVIQRKVDQIEVLLQNRPSAESIQAVFPSVEGLPASLRVDIARRLLDAGGTGGAINAALSSAMGLLSNQRDHAYIRTLVQGGADVGQQQGGLFYIATRSGDHEALTILLQGEFPATLLAPCVPVAMELERQRRYEIMETLLRNGARGLEVSRALVDSIDGTDSGRNLAALLLAAGEADTGFEEGRAVKKAIVSQNLEFLRLLVQYNHLTPSKFRSCLLLAINLPWDAARLEKARLLLTTAPNMSGDLGMVALRAEMEGMRQHRDETLEMIRLLLKAGANVSYNNGEIVCDAIELGLFQCFELYLSFSLSPDARSAVFEKALAYALKTLGLRYIDAVLQTDTPQFLRDQALLRACKEDGRHPLVLRLLDSHASVNYDKGASICAAISRVDLKLLLPLLQHAPSGVSLAQGFESSMAIANVQAKFEAFRLLLEAGEIPSHLLNGALTLAAGGGQRMVAICELLLKYKASPSDSQGTPLCRALGARDYDISILQLLLQFSPSKNAIAAALNCAFSALKGQKRLAAVNLLLTSAKPQSTLDQLLLNAVQERPRDDDLIRSLLRANAAVLHQGGECIFHAVMKNDMQLLSMFQPSFTGQSGVLSAVFQKAWRNNARVTSHQAALSLLLRSGAAGEYTSIALVETIRTSASSPTGFSFIYDLFNAGADVNYDHGASLIEAAQQGNLRVLKELFTHSPRRNNMTAAFPHIFMSGMDSTTLQRLIESFCSHPSCPKPNHRLPHFGPIPFLLLKNYPNEKQLLEYLIDAGYEADPVIATGDREPESLLCWALAQDKNTISEDIIDVLLVAGANANYKTPKSDRTPLEMAISTSRAHSVAALLRCDADPQTTTSRSMSPLSYAAVSGENRAIVRLLLNAGGTADDWLLHSAARDVNIPAIQVLIEEAQIRDTPSSRFQGRTALAELCLNARDKPVHDLKQAITLLQSRGDIARISNGKSLLHYALDNQDATPVTQALLDTFMHEFLNDEFNLYTANGLTYSPFAYVKKGANAAPRSQREALTSLLQQFGCRDRFWAATGDQPPDVTNPPDHITELLKEDEAHKRHLARRRAEHAQEQEAITTQHRLTLDNQKVLAREVARNDIETAERRKRLTTAQYNQDLIYANNLADQAQKRAEEANRAQVDFIQRRGLLEQKQRDQVVKADAQRRQDELEFTEAQQRLITGGFRERARIEQQSREANALQFRQRRELEYQVGPGDLD